MADYIPPIGYIPLNLNGSYTPPVGYVPLNLGGSDLPSTLAIIGRTGGARGALRLRQTSRGAVAGRTGGARGSIRVAYDPNLLSAVHAVTAAGWRDGAMAPAAMAAHWRDAQAREAALVERGRDAGGVLGETADRWRESPPVSQMAVDRWREATVTLHAATARWRQSLFLPAATTAAWTDARRETGGVTATWVRTLLLAPAALVGSWRQGVALPRAWAERYRDGARIVVPLIDHWRQAGYPANAANPGPPIVVPPVYVPPVGYVPLDLRCPLPRFVGYVPLNLQWSPCPDAPLFAIPIQRTYRVLNTAALVRWPDLTPLPCTAMTIETDISSWCWALSATLVGASAWPLVRPNPLPREVLATINGYQWRFLLDDPPESAAFNSHTVTLKGRSRTAWLADPYTPPRNLSQINARDMRQLAEAALENTGFSVDWQLEDWSVPAGRYIERETPIGALLKLAATTADAVYSHPTDAVITLYKRWPMAGWLVDGQSAAIQIPADAIRSITQTPTYSTPYNGVYVSGTTHGARALVKIAGTDGALQPDAPIIHEWLCDAAGIGARQRGINALSDSGAGLTVEADLLLLPETQIIRPGMVVDMAGVKGVSRSIRITAGWEDGLNVNQAIGLERREVEA